MIAIICQHCMRVAIFDEPAKPGEVRYCPCLDHPPITSPVAYMRLRLPEGFEIVRKTEVSAQ
jgi:hypothetical protein